MTEEDMRRDFAGKGTTALSIIGTILGGLGVLNDGSSILGTMGGANNYVTKETFDISMQLNKAERDNALLAAELNTEKKMVEVYNALNDKINVKVAEQQAINASQAVTNSAVTSTLAVHQNNINQLMSMTQLYIPATNVTPFPMSRYNSWTAPTNPTTEG